MDLWGSPIASDSGLPSGRHVGGRRAVGLVSGESRPPAEEGERKSCGSTDAENVMALRAYSVRRSPGKAAAGAGAAILLLRLLRLLLPSSNLPRRCIRLWFPLPAAAAALPFYMKALFRPSYRVTSSEKLSPSIEMFDPCFL